MTVLILGGTAEARELAEALAGRSVISSLAGRVSRPALPVGEVRIGGFGGVDGLAAFLTERRVSAVVDATHPFADQISAHAAAAARATGCPLLRLERPGWRTHPDADRWTWVDSVAAARQVAEPARRPFVTTGRQSLETFLPWADRTVVVRVVEPPELDLPSRWVLVQSRGPYDVASERTLMTGHGVDALLTKDSGGTHTEAKLTVAAELGLPVVVVARPAPPPGVEVVPTVAACLTWLA